MKERKTAYFVRNAHRLEDLQSIHLLDAEKPYEIIKTVQLSKIDYENFSTDLLADRAFLDGFSESKQSEAALLCIFVHQQGKKDGILAVPTADGHVGLAAYINPVFNDITD